MKGCWILLKAFSASIEIIKWVFLFLLLLICCITFNDLPVLNHPCIPGMKPLGYGIWSFWYVVEFGLPLFYWVLHLCSLRRLACSLFFNVSLSSYGMSVILAS
jgi:hypothetical protein